VAANMIQTAMHIPPDLLDRIDEAAKRAGISRAAWIRDACRGKLEWEKLTEKQREAILAGTED
jgi:metal-responsive CopG/Arc/MetJ family transcriptional regulator